MQTLADTYTENTEFLNKLADQTEEFAVQLIDQVTASEQLVIRDVPENVDRCASMLSGMTDAAIVHSQKKVGIFMNDNFMSILFLRLLKTPKVNVVSLLASREHLHSYDIKFYYLKSSTFPYSFV